MADAADGGAGVGVSTPRKGPQGQLWCTLTGQRHMTKHISVCAGSLFANALSSKTFVLITMATEDQMANIFTKALGQEQALGAHSWSLPPR